MTLLPAPHVAMALVLSMTCADCKQAEVPTISVADASPPLDGASSVPGAVVQTRRGTSAPGNCQLGQTFEQIFAGQPHKECGTLHVDDVGSAAGNARACALDAAAQKKSFALSWDTRGIDSVIRTGIAGRAGDAGYELFWIDYDGCPGGCGDGDPHSTTRECSELRDLRVMCRRPRRVADGGVVTMTVLTDECRHAQPLELGCAMKNVIAHCP